jgi:hypothetical protein
VAEAKHILLLYTSTLEQYLKKAGFVAKPLRRRIMTTDMQQKPMGGAGDTHVDQNPK